MINEMSNSEAKNAIFAAIRQNLAASEPYDELHQAHHRNPLADLAAPVLNETSRYALIENFRKSLEFVGGKFLPVTSEAEAAEALDSIIEAKKAREIPISDALLVKTVAGLSKSAAEFIENAAADVLFESDLGVTSAQWAIAETGTLVLEAESERHRLTSLVPPVHVCLLDAANIRQTLGEILALLQTNLSRTITFVTGASRTSDIELTLAVGVHGPGELHVILIDRVD